MIELPVVSLLVLALLVLAARKGHRHLLRPGLPLGVAAGGALCGYLLESLPFTEFRAEPSPQTILGVLVGALAARIAARGIAGWARGVERDVAKGAPDDPGVRLIHPAIAAGLFVATVPLVYGMVAARHETLEVRARRRDPATAVLRGAEPVRLAAAPGAANGRGVLLLHGWLGSPADFGDLPKDLAAAGFEVSVPLLPGHGTVPSALEAATQEDIAAAVRAARASLAAGGRRVSIVGMSYGGSLALLESAAEPPEALVLVNPLLGTLATPSFVPVSSDTLLDVAARMFRLSFRPVGLTRCNDPEGRKRQVAYATFPLAPCVAARDTSRRAAAVPSVASPALLMLSDMDRTTPADASEAWFGGVAAPSKEVRRHPRSDHLLLLDHDAPAASDAILRFLTTKR